MVAGALGLATAAVLPAVGSARSTESASTLMSVRIREHRGDGIDLRTVHALRDEAEALTPAEVLLDERARERWLPVMAELRDKSRDPVQPLVVRLELEATLAALDRAGI